MRTLYQTSLLPSCRKIRILLREKELDFDIVQENFWQRREEFFELNPAGEVPVLVEDDGEVIAGNYAITEYLEEAYRDNSKRYIGSSISERAEVRRIVEWFDYKFNAEVTNNILFEKIFKRLLRYGEPQSDAIRAGKKNILYHI
ncbi:MAG: glutathione S-transferase family protein, partial [Pseudomonadota bacterium]